MGRNPRRDRWRSSSSGRRPAKKSAADPEIDYGDHDGQPEPTDHGGPLSVRELPPRVAGAVIGRIPRLIDDSHRLADREAALVVEGSSTLVPEAIQFELVFEIVMVPRVIGGDVARGAYPARSEGPEALLIASRHQLDE